VGAHEEGLDMKIAINASIVDPFLSGLGIYAVHLFKELAKLHDDVVVYTSHPEVCEVNSTRFRRIGWRVQISYGRMGHLRRLIWTQMVLPLRLLADRATLLFSPLPEGMLLPTIPQVIVVHDILPLRFPQEYPRQQYYFRYLVPAMLNKARAVVTGSESTRQDLLTFYRLEASKIHVVPDGYDQSRYRVGLLSQAIKQQYGLPSYLLYVGNLLPHKNLHRLLQAFAPISRKFPHTLVIAGRKDPRCYPPLEAEARALGVQDRVRFLDYVPAADLPALYAAADVFVLPSLYEGFGLPILEAMACGTPVIAAYTSSMPEVASDAAMLVDPYDVPAISMAIESALGDVGMREAMRRRGLARVAQFSWARTALMLLKILEKVAA
jgi:glycosyltransferase involved in cell wall biosynthesis